jgi:hypothetical protein
MFFSLRRAKQLSLVQEDGTNRAVNSETPQEAEDEVSWYTWPCSGGLPGLCYHELLLSPAVPVTG